MKGTMSAQKSPSMVRDGDEGVASRQINEFSQKEKKKEIQLVARPVGACVDVDEVGAVLAGRRMGRNDGRPPTRGTVAET